MPIVYFDAKASVNLRLSIAKNPMFILARDGNRLYFVQILKDTQMYSIYAVKIKKP
jgi:hypothetical protein